MKFTAAAIITILAFACQPTDKQAESYKNIEKHIQSLSADSCLGRAPMSEAEDRVVQYIAAQMQNAGLQPANQGSWFQDVPMMQVKSQMSPKLTCETPAGTIEFEKLSGYVSFSRRAEESIAISQSELIFAGFGINAPEYQHNDFAGIDVKGKTILVFVNDPGYGQSGEYFKGNTMTYYGRWTYKYEEAARQGAEACFIIHETGPAGYPWGVVQNNGDGTDLYLKQEDGYRDRCKLEGWISKEAAEQLFAACGLSFDDAKQQALKPGFKPFSLNTKMSASLKNEISYGQSKNVCGLVKGTERPDEVVVYTAHWDHLGVGHPIDGDSIYNGASDNAAAVAWLLEIAKNMQQNPPKRSVLFLSVTAEESGLLGASHYVQHPFFPMNKTVACINTDVILFLGKFRDICLTGYRQSELDGWIEKEASKQNRYIAPDPNPENGMYFRSDQFPFVKEGVPSIFAKGYIEAEKLGKKATAEQIAHYWKETYHKPSDQFLAERDNLDGLVQDAQLMEQVGRNLANSNSWPGWNIDSEFKAIREKSFLETAQKP